MNQLFLGDIDWAAPSHRAILLGDLDPYGVHALSQFNNMIKLEVFR
jgi:hypothetical protein